MNPTKDIPSEMWKEIMKSIKIDSLSCLGNLLLVSKTFYEDVFKCCDFTPVQTAILKRFANKGKIIHRSVLFTVFKVERDN